jgi:tetratricopeptide (TPR) repeat protein
MKSNSVVDQTDSLEAALSHGWRLLGQDPAAAIDQAREILHVRPSERGALRLLAAALRRAGKLEAAQDTELEVIKVSAQEPALLNAANAISERRWKEAERLLMPYLERHPNDAAGLNMFAKIAGQVGAYGYAEVLLRRALEVAPRFSAAQLQLADVLLQKGDRGAALEILDQLLEAQPEHLKAKIAKATTLGRVGEYDRALAQYEELADRFPRNAQIWMIYGHLLKTVGRLEASISAYRTAIDLKPTYGEVWWSLANLKTVTLDENDQSLMQSVLSENLDDDDRLHIHFALGKALEDAEQYEASFRHYRQGNEIRRVAVPYDRAKIEDQVSRSKAVFTSDFFSRHGQEGFEARDPVFILGMPRAGSTLLEQILASHSAIEGTSELPHIIALSHQLRGEKILSSQDPYPELLESLPADQVRALGQEYLRLAGAHRKADRPLFIDKQPNNWLHIGLIHLILPNAKIIDARRHPMSCCFSNYKQHFAHGQAFSYSLPDMAHYYRQYVELLQHFDELLPGRIHRVIHEELVEQPEKEIQRLLDYLELPFEEKCLRFHENSRPVWTPSAEQVRRPINREGLDQWKVYEPWLAELKQALGPVLDCYPEPPRLI